MKSENAVFSHSVKKTANLHHAIEAPRAQLAVYDSLLAPPKVSTLEAGSLKDFLSVLSVKTYEAVRSLGSALPFVVIREIVENLIHADFKEPVISVLDGGKKICISDQGNGIPDKEKAFQPGFTTAQRWQKSYIRGVGSGLPVAKEILTASGGKILIENNLDRGTVVTILLNETHNRTQDIPFDVRAPRGIETLSSELAKALQDAIEERPSGESAPFAGPQDARPLSDREKKTLLVLAELGQAGPSQLAKELQMSIPTAHRELHFLETAGLAIKVRGGKRTLTEKGTQMLEKVFKEEEAPQREA